MKFSVDALKIKIWSFFQKTENYFEFKLVKNGQKLSILTILSIKIEHLDFNQFLPTVRPSLQSLTAGSGKDDFIGETQRVHLKPIFIGETQRVHLKPGPDFDDILVAKKHPSLNFGGWRNILINKY